MNCAGATVDLVMIAGASLVASSSSLASVSKQDRSWFEGLLSAAAVISCLRRACVATRAVSSSSNRSPPLAVRFRRPLSAMVPICSLCRERLRLSWQCGFGDLQPRDAAARAGSAFDVVQSGSIRVCHLQNMIRKSGRRFSEKIMLNKKPERDGNSKQRHHVLASVIRRNRSRGCRHECLRVRNTEHPAPVADLACFFPNSDCAGQMFGKRTERRADDEEFV